MAIVGTDSSETLIGTAGDDTLFPLLGNDIVRAGNGNDSVYARDTQTPANTNEGNDSFYGEAGNDTLSADGGLGNHLLDGGTGNDTLYGGNGNDLLIGGDGYDTLYDQSAGLDTLQGGAGDDYLSTYTSTGNASLDGGAGNDSLYGSDGNDTLAGGTGADLLWGAAGNDLYQISSRDFNLYDSGGTDAAVLGISFVKLPSSIETVSYTNSALALPYWLDALLAGEAASFAMLLGPSKTFSYAFPASLPAYNDSPVDANGFTGFNTQQQLFTREALAYVATVLDLRFVEAASADALNTISFANNAQASSAGYATQPGAFRESSDVFLDVDTASGNLAPADGQYSALTLIHEIGHALGLKHPFSHADARGDVGEGPYLPDAEDTTSWTVMSYVSDAAQYHLTYSALDIAALQYLYGPSTTARTAIDSYVVSAEATNFVWDGGGADTLDASAQTLPVTLYLESGYWGYVGSKASTITADGQITVNFGTVIEDLKGGAGADTLVGNSANNAITGGAGNDTIDGGAGTDQARFNGVQSNYTVVTTPTGYTVTDNVGTDGTDTLVNIESLVFVQAPVTQTIQALAYSWKAHTLLSDVPVSNGALSHVTAGDGAINFEAPIAASQTLTASRAVPAAEASLTNSAVNLQDAIAILKMIVGLDVNGAGKPLSPYQALAADYDGNGAVQLTDAIGVLKHVVGLTAPQPTWHFVNELDTTVPAKANLNPGTPQTSISANTSGSSPVHVGLVGYLSGDVDGSFAGAVGALDLDARDTGYFTALVASHQGLNLTQFGVYGQ
jgi:Ca2+-binding RTX toxin-like protein